MRHNLSGTPPADPAEEGSRIRERAERTERDLAATFHELRTPITNIMGFAETLLAGVAAGNPAKTERFLGIISAQAGRMAKLLDDLQTLLELESGRRIPAPEPVPLNAAVIRSLERSAEQRNNRHLSLRCEVAGDIVVTADPDLLNLVLLSLLANAVTNTPDGGTITITGSVNGTITDMTVTDTGIGIPEEALPRLCDRFFRVDVARSREQGGNGLGLTLVREIVRRHGGEVSIESSPGRGTSVTLRLPALS